MSFLLTDLPFNVLDEVTCFPKQLFVCLVVLCLTYLVFVLFKWLEFIGKKYLNEMFVKQ